MNKIAQVKILECISKDDSLQPEEALALSEQLLQLFRQKPIIKEIIKETSTPCPLQHYPTVPFFPCPCPCPDPQPEPFYPQYDYTTSRTDDPMPPPNPITFCSSIIQTYFSIE